jgi:acyl-CoA thioester hydrolase
MPVVPHLYACPLRWGDMDSFGHVNNVRYASYVQEARLDLFRATGAESLASTVLASQRLVHLAPLSFDGRPLWIATTVTRIGHSSFGLAFEAYQEGADGDRVDYLRAYATLVAFDFATGKTRPLTEAERAALEGHLAPGTAPEPTAYGEPRHAEVGHFPVQVRFADIDAGGIVSNVQAIELFQEARIGLLLRQLEAVAPGTPMPGMVVAQQDLEYVAPIVYRPEPYDAWTWVSRVGTTSMTLEAEIRDPLAGAGADARLMARGRFPLVFVDLATGAAQPPAPQLRAVIEESLR